MNQFIHDATSSMSINAAHIVALSYGDDHMVELTNGNKYKVGHETVIALENLPTRVIPAQPGFRLLWWWYEDGQEGFTTETIIAWQFVDDLIIPVTAAGPERYAAVIEPNGNVVETGHERNVFKSIEEYGVYRRQECGEAVISVVQFPNKETV